ncbi:hypothetical protein [Veillonella montpellierensis]|nr:hypothetical protein [Veillonella montpellierensis]
MEQCCLTVKPIPPTWKIMPIEKKSKKHLKMEGEAVPVILQR